MTTPQEESGALVEHAERLAEVMLEDMSGEECADGARLLRRDG